MYFFVIDSLCETRYDVAALRGEMSCPFFENQKLATGT